MKKFKIVLAYSALILTISCLGACGGGGGKSTSNNNSSNTTTQSSSNWDEMKWDQGNWK